MPQERGDEDKILSQLGLEIKGSEVPLRTEGCPKTIPEELSMEGASTGGMCQALSTSLSVFLSFSDFNFLVLLKRRKPEEVKCAVSTHYISH